MKEDFLTNRKRISIEGIVPLIDISIDPRIGLSIWANLDHPLVNLKDRQILNLILETITETTMLEETHTKSTIDILHKEDSIQESRSIGNQKTTFGSQMIILGNQMIILDNQTTIFEGAISGADLHTKAGTHIEEKVKEVILDLDSTNLRHFREGSSTIALTSRTSSRRPND